MNYVNTEKYHYILQFHLVLSYNLAPNTTLGISKLLSIILNQIEMIPASSTTKKLGTMMTNDWMTNETISFMVTSNNTQSTMMTNNWMTNETTSFMETSNNTQSTPTTLVAITRNLTTTQESAVTLSSNVTYSRISTTSQNVTITNMSTVPQTQGQTTSTRANEGNSLEFLTAIEIMGYTSNNLRILGFMSCYFLDL